MYSLREDEIDYILHDIESRGVVLEDLRDDLLDHICCIIERELPEGGDFVKFYEFVLPRFFKKKLAEIQEETDNLIRFKNFGAEVAKRTTLVKCTSVRVV
jgi:glycogen synthase